MVYVPCKFKSVTYLCTLCSPLFIFLISYKMRKKIKSHFQYVFEISAVLLCLCKIN